jgi:hypothetical protein
MPVSNLLILDFVQACSWQIGWYEKVRVISAAPQFSCSCMSRRLIVRFVETLNPVKPVRSISLAGGVAPLPAQSRSVMVLQAGLIAILLIINSHEHGP